ncbi:hypothetical protein K2D_25490 [Planctomycetes bacterium K2D]|uniref:Uncharacterized protein n=1 Tax=Botrimarina mediterranea TaxID=2528022 RepID=A0A518K972_9BACT|nr:hypothetical protein Spa11_25470 [Botrimarina mediterranea]QDV78940.1 hypothetical protein K2D_25490 [Planctomycetes bacterium K2D]
MEARQVCPGLGAAVECSRRNIEFSYSTHALAPRRKSGEAMCRVVNRLSLSLPFG